MDQMRQFHHCLWCYLQAQIRLSRKGAMRGLRWEINLTRHLANFQTTIVPKSPCKAAGKQH